MKVRHWSTATASFIAWQSELMRRLGVEPPAQTWMLVWKPHTPVSIADLYQSETGMVQWSIDYYGVQKECGHVTT